MNPIVLPDIFLYWLPKNELIRLIRYRDDHIIEIQNRQHLSDEDKREQINDAEDVKASWQVALN